MRRAGGAIVAASLAAGLACAPAASGQGRSSYDASIRFDWVDAMPTALSEHDPLRGQRRLSPVQDPQEWTTRQQVNSAQSDILVEYGNGTSIFPYRSFRNAPRVDVTVARPGFTCDPASLDRMEQALQQSTDQKLAAMLAAGRLIDAPPVSCPPSSKRRLSDYYYRLNCQLTTTTSYVGYIERAEALYRARWASNEAKLAYVPLCKSRSQEFYRNTVAAWIETFQAREQFASAAALGRDAMALQSDADWQDAFASYALSETAVAALEIRALLADQMAAYAAGNLMRASAENEQLQQLAANPENEGALERAGVDRERIAVDAARIRQAAVRSAIQF